MLLTQSARFNCFLIKPDIINLNYEEEGWLDETKYAFGDDQVFFYKAFLAGKRQYFCFSPSFNHLDYGSSSPERNKDGAYANGRNMLIFWYRFQYSRAKDMCTKTRLLLGFAYRIFVYAAFNLLRTVVIRKNIIGSYVNGLAAGVKAITTKK